jgi:hypothetical protein
MGEQRELDGTSQAVGIERRELLKRGALVGGAGAVAWGAPAVTRFAGPAFGATDGTPLARGRGISYIAFHYQCGTTATRYSMKLEFGGEGADAYIQKCEVGDFKTPRGQNTHCEFTPSGNGNKDHCPSPNGHGSTVQVTFLDGTHTVRVTMPNGCLIEGVALGKCGSPASVDEPCLYVAPAAGSTTATFALCGD